MSHPSLRMFIEETGYEVLENPLKKEYEVALELKNREGSGRSTVFSILEGPEYNVGNVIDTRSKLYKAIGVSSDEEAYIKMSSLLESPPQPKIHGFDESEYHVSSRKLLDLPFVKFYEKDGGYYLTASILVACHNGACNASFHRMMFLDKESAAVRIVPRHLWKMYRDAVKEKGRLPVTLVLGIHPAYLIAAASSPPYGVLEFSIASGILGTPLVESPVHSNPIPNLSSCVVEGYLTSTMVDEGPFADILLLYDEVRKQPVLKVEKAYCRSDEPRHVILSGGLEHLNLMGFPREVLIWKTVSQVVPKVYGVRLTPGGGGWFHAVISVEKNHPGDAKNAILAAFAGHPSLKHVVVVDPDIDIDDPKEVEWAIATRFQADRDLVLIKNVRGSTLDPSGIKGFTSKMGIDATAPEKSIRFEKARIPALNNSDRES